MVMGLNFAKSKRLLTAKDFQFVFSSAEVKTSCPELLLLARFNQQPQSRLGLVIAKKHVKLAVTRNRLKRQIRESFRLQTDNLPSLDIVILARSGCGGLDNPSFNRILEKQWQRLIRRATEKSVC
jgi:ribonuclease P protein component